MTSTPPPTSLWWDWTLRKAARRSEYLAMLLGLLALYWLARGSGSPLDGFSYDSFRYLAGAEAISRGLGYRDFSGGWSLHWPPGLSSILAAASVAAGRPPEELYRWAQAAAYVTSCLALGSILRRAAPNATVMALAAFCLLLNRHFVTVHALLWSEPLAVACALLSVASLLKAQSQDEPAPAMFLLAGALAGLAVACRWAMVVVPAAAMAAILFRAAGRGRIVASAAYGFAAVATPSLILFWTKPAAPLDGWSFDGSSRAWPALAGFADLANQLIPQRWFLGLASWAYLILLILLALAGVWCVARGRLGFGGGGCGGPLDARTRRPAAPSADATVLLSVTSVAYLTLCSLAPLTNQAAQPTLRILYPSYLFLLPAALLGCQYVARQTPRRGYEHAIVAVLIVGLGLGAARAALGVLGLVEPRTAGQADPDHAGAVRSAVNELREIARSRSESACVITNAPGLAWYATRRTTFGLEVETKSVEERCSGEAVLVAFLRPEHPGLVRFVEYHGPLECADVAGHCDAALPESNWLSGSRAGSEATWSIEFEP